ncbi:SOS response-associated peptidase [Mycobacterium sp.]|jgi:putative SOS response-associated peptidase YedK|uniref:SOS response-associated peptidase n=1 Tax=Mycobacterium sp. TaxID=1785 RepID=UPI002D4F1B6A|nr:SOS response-associated peptidase [Mycobacterium sp.]HZA10068.1 SOS response-associated peptidase [Mycobacterium sp.]
MCGRFAVTTDPALLAEKIQAIDEASKDAAAPNYNVAPTTNIAAVVRRHSEPDDDPTRRLRLMRWGLVPPWVKAGPDGGPDNKGPQLINARADKVTTSPAFRSSAKGKRCLIPMSGWYEWRKNPDTPSGKKAHKTPFYMTPGDDNLICMAGLWSVWRPKDASKADPPLLSCTIITTDAVGPLAEIHNRMPLMIDERDWDRWLDPDAPLEPELLTVRADLSDLEIREISTLVNSVRNNGPELIEPAQPQGSQETLL